MELFRLPNVGVALMMFGSAASLSAAELVYFKNGRSMTIEAHRMGPDRAVLTLLGRGRLEIAVDWIDRFVPLSQGAAASVAPAVPDKPVAKRWPDREEVDRIIREVTHKHGLDEKLVRSIIRAESNFDPQAVSDKGASGLMQLMPKTASAYRVEDVFDAGENVEAGVKYLKHLMAEFNRNLTLVLAAYNAGSSAVRSHQGIPPFAETHGYIRQVLSFYREKVPLALAVANKPAESSLPRRSGSLDKNNDRE